MSESGGSVDVGGLSSLLGAATREVTMFAAVGLLIGGIDDLLVDAIYFARRLRNRIRNTPALTLEQLPASAQRMAIFIPAWDEAAVIGAMLDHALASLDGAFTIFVGAYPNDWATIEAVAAVAERDPRVRLVIGTRAGPTTKADCLNGLWRAMRGDEERTGEAFAAVVLRDAEDVVHPGELRVFDHMLARAEAVQLPVLPLARPGAHLVGGTYLDEFAEMHGKALVVREAIGAGLPLAGVGCAIARPMLALIAADRGGTLFDATSLTEDYELGLTIAARGGRVTLAVVPETAGGSPVAVRAYFPSTLDTAVRQKTRWLIGIALAGWDRVGWGRKAHLGEQWMRMRDRRAPLAMLVLVAAYASLLLWTLAVIAMLFGAPRPAPPEGALALLLVVNGAFLLWRLAMRASFVGRRYGRVEAWLSIPRMLVGNIVAMIAARRALVRYVGMLHGVPVAWDKTAHEFPDAAEAAS